MTDSNDYRLREESIDTVETKEELAEDKRLQRQIKHHLFRSQQKVSFSFKAGPLNAKIPVSCELTGITGFLELPALPVVFSYQHPLSRLENCKSLLKACKDNKKYLKYSLDRQTLAGIVLSYLNNLKLIANEPQLNAIERNLILQGAGNNLLDVVARFLNALSNSPYIQDHLSNKKRFPQFSFTWALTVNKQSFSQSLFQFTRTIQRATDPEAIEEERVGNISLDLILAKREPSAEQVQRRLKIVTNLKNEKRLFKDLQDATKAVLEDIEDTLPKDLRSMVRMIVRNMHLGLAESHARLVASKLELLDTDEAKLMARNIRQCVGHHTANVLVDDEISSTQPAIRKTKSVAEILAEKKAKAAGILVEVQPRTTEEEKEFIEHTTEEVADEDSLEEEKEDTFDFYTRLNRRS